LEEVFHPALGRIVQPRPAPRTHDHPDTPRRPAPSAGEHTDEILAEAGFTTAEVDDLRSAAVVG
jgi:crotonobetainyl-CoA:carnitine CoA-transferase CaiB-like acyl-CoA transferase